MGKHTSTRKPRRNPAKHRRSLASHLARAEIKVSGTEYEPNALRCEPDAPRAPADPHTKGVLDTADADNSIRWRPGDRLDHYFEQRCDEVPEDHLAVITEDESVTFRELDNRANQTARFLRERGINAGDRVAVLFDKSTQCYVGLLAILKLGAAYVPLDASFPSDRISFILEDAGVKDVVSVSQFAAKLSDFAVHLTCLDAVSEGIDAHSSERLNLDERPSPDSDQLFYIIYTSGTTGKPKGVAIDHAGICNFVKVAGEVYGYTLNDRCYQGITLAFDFHVEDLWTPLIRGVTLVAGKSGTSLFGADLHAHLTEHHVTVLPCVPTLWATIEDDLPAIRIIQLSGEAVPHNLVAQWHREGRVILNAYGPTECSVSSTMKILTPGNPVTIGVPLPTYSIVILDEHSATELKGGAIGEICIAGIGLARGYLNREELTGQKFIPDFLNLPNNPSHRIYRTGDYGRIRDDGELEFHGRIDTQVKLRGYRIELGEIEAVLAQMPEIAQAVVNPHETAPGTTELVAYYTRKHGAPTPSLTEVAGNLRRQLPPYMLPGYLEELPSIPMTPNHKADRKALPGPKGPRFSMSSSKFAAPENETETRLADILGDVLSIKDLSVDDNFFEDLGAHSLLMARFSSEIRKRMNVHDISMRDIYLNPTIRKLAGTLESRRLELPSTTPAVSEQEKFHFPSNFDYWRCGVLQLSSYLAWIGLVLWMLISGVQWTYQAMPDLSTVYLRCLVVIIGIFVVLSAIPVALKWILIGRWKRESIPIWSMRYFIFWIVKSAMRVAPVAMVDGPLRNAYLRMLGAKIGANTVIRTMLVPVCTDLIDIGANTVIGKDTVFQGYKARSNYIHIGSISVGSNAFVGEAAVLDINTVMEDGSQLGHASSLHEGQKIPRGKRYHATPAMETLSNYCAIATQRCTAFRRWFYSLSLLSAAIALLAASITAIDAGFAQSRAYALWLQSAFLAGGVTLGWAVAELVAISFALYLTALLLWLAAIGIVPRLLNLLITEGKVYGLSGFHYLVHQLITMISNSVFFNRLFGDSSAIVYYVQWVGYRLNRVIQTGSNFGPSQRHDNPFLCDIGSGTMVSGGLKMINETMSSDAFRVGTVKVGQHNYLGNYLHIPVDSKVGENCLVATKALVPIDGELSHDTGLLGSPTFVIPRANSRDLEMAKTDDDTKCRKLRSKNRYNTMTAALYILNNWALVLLQSTSVIIMLALYPSLGMVAVFVVGALAFAADLGWRWIAERSVLRFGSLEPRIVPLLNEYFWFHERTWKMTALWFVAPLFAGTPFKNIFSRMEGIQIGKRVFDDGAYFDDYTLIHIGDYVNLNSHCVIQPHSLEEAVFKSGRVFIGRGATIDCAANLHYDVTIGDFAVIGPNSFVMKGEEVENHATWQGNPARPSPSSSHQLVAGDRAQG